LWAAVRSSDGTRLVRITAISALMGFFRTTGFTPGSKASRSAGATKA
jgi:hypothetical protein